MSMLNTSAQNLQQKILSGVYKEGQMLPGQRDLAESLGVSRASLREALSMLEALGLVRSVPNKGTLVTKREKTSEHALSSIALIQAQATFQFRFVIEPAAAALAARAIGEHSSVLKSGNIDSHATPRLWDMHTGFEDALKELDLIKTSDFDLKFHQLIAELSGNFGLQHVLSDFSDDVGRSVRLPLANHHRLWEAVEEHRVIAAAISEGDFTRAYLAMQNHLRNAALRVGITFTEP